MSHKPHYAWLICLGGCLSLMICMGLGANVYTIYQPEVIAQNGFTNAQGSWITTTRSLFILATLLTVNQLCDHLGLRLVMTLGMALVGIGCFSFGAAGSFPMYCVSAAITGVGYCLGGMVPLSLIIANWFHAHRSLALGIASAGSGLTTIFMPPVIIALIRDYSLRAAFFAEGAFILIVTALTWFLLRSDPKDMGLLPYGEEVVPVEEVKAELKENGIVYGEVELGIMIETPAAVMVSDELAKEVDFFSIGTNDLTQYTLAIDRQNAKLDDIYDSHHPAVLKMIQMVIENGHKGGAWVGICGELGADLTLTDTFVEMGIDELSVSPSCILPIRKKIREHS